MGPEAAATNPTTLRRTPLDALHRALGARMVPFAGYDMPVQYPAGIVAEHKHTRSAAGLFDVSHMGQVRITGRDPAAALERLVPADVAGLGMMRQRYSMFTNEAGGILDDLMIVRVPDGLALVVNAACKEADVAHLVAGLPDCTVEHLEDRALLALQGPGAAAVMARLAPGAERMPFMSAAGLAVAGVPCFVTRSGYTGEDGWEISCAASAAEGLAQSLLREPEVAPIGLGARDSLRLEAGLCLYGHDIDETTTPIEAVLAWTIARRRREAGGFPGDAVIRRQLAEGPPRRRVGLRPEGRVIAREGTTILDSAGKAIGRVTSGGFGPSVETPVGMGYVEAAHAAPGTPLGFEVRGAARPGQITKLPFFPHRYATS